MTNDPADHFGDYIAQLVTTAPAPPIIGAVSADEILREMREMVEEFEAAVARDHKTILVAAEDEARVRAAVRGAWADRWFDVTVMPGLPTGGAYVVSDDVFEWLTEPYREEKP